MSRRHLQRWAPRAALLGTVLLLSGPGQAMDRFSAPTGQLGANLSFDPSQRVRLHTEMSYFTASNGITLHSLGWTFGAGVKVTDAIEIEVGVPVGGMIVSGALNTNQFGVGNLSLGANYFAQLGGALRLKLGGAVAFGPWNQANGAATVEGSAVVTSGVTTKGYQDLWLYMPGYVHLVVPARIELGDALQFTADGSLHLAVPTLNADSELYVILAPGIAFWATPKFALGARLPLQVLTGTDAAQLSFEPFLRFNLGETGFLSTRFTMHLDDDLGFSFDTGGYWGLHLAFGGSF